MILIYMMTNIKEFDFRLETINSLYKKCNNIKKYFTDIGYKDLQKGAGKEHDHRKDNQPHKKVIGYLP